MQMAGETESENTASINCSMVSYPSISMSLASFALSSASVMFSSSQPAPEDPGGGARGGGRINCTPMRKAGCGHRVECGLYGIIPGMKKDDVKQVLGRVLTWPEPAQEEAVALLRAIEKERVGGGDYHATAEELNA